MLKISLTFLLLSVFTIKFIYGHQDPLPIVSRNEWKAESSSKEIANLELPANNVVIIHTASQFCDNKVDCLHQVKSIQHYHMKDQKFDDIAYNFLIGGDGKIYEGRGWDKQGAHTKGYNNVAIGIAFIGNYMEVEPKTAQLDALRMLLTYGVETNKLTNDYKLYGHRQLRPTLSPGDKIYDVIKTWEHWSEKF